MEMLVRLTTPEALHGVLSVLHARRVEVRHLRYDGCTLRVGLAAPPPQLGAQVARRVDVLSVELAQSRCTVPSSARRQPGLWATSQG